MHRQTHVDSLSALLAVLSDAVPLVISRQLLSAFAVAIATLPPDTHKVIAEQYGPGLPT